MLHHASLSLEYVDSLMNFVQEIQTRTICRIVARGSNFSTSLGAPAFVHPLSFTPAHAKSSLKKTRNLFSWKIEQSIGRSRNGHFVLHPNVLQFDFKNLTSTSFQAANSNLQRSPPTPFPYLLVNGIKHSF